MKILIATGIFKPEIGGPATYVPNLAFEFKKLGHEIMVITYSDKISYDFDVELGYKVKRIKRKNLILNYVNYFFEIKKVINNFDVIYAFDYFSAGLPCLFASMLKRKKLVMRTGGDLIWERHLSKTGEGITLRDFYQKKIYKKYAFKFFLAKLFFKYCDLVIFNSKFQGEIFKKYYEINEKKIKYLFNPITQKINIEPRSNVKKEIIWAGRMEEKNNIRRLVKVFYEMKVEDYKLILVGEGSLKKELEKYVEEKNCNNIVFEDKVTREKLIEILKVSYGMILPSYTDISPNQAIECLSAGTPFIITREHGIDWLRGKVIEFDPNNKEEIKNAIKKMMNSDFEKNFQNLISKIDYKYSYEDAAKDTIELINNISK